MRRTVFIALLVLLAAFIISIPAQAQEPVRCVTIIPIFQDTPAVSYQKVAQDDGLAIAAVGHYFWMQNIAGEPTADHSVVSVDLNVLPAEEVTLCVGDTSYTEAEAELFTKTVEGPPEWQFETPGPEPRVIRVWIPL